MRTTLTVSLIAFLSATSCHFETRQEPFYYITEKKSICAQRIGEAYVNLFKYVQGAFCMEDNSQLSIEAAKKSMGLNTNYDHDKNKIMEFLRKQKTCDNIRIYVRYTDLKHNEGTDKNISIYFTRFLKDYTIYTEFKFTYNDRNILKDSGVATISTNELLRAEFENLCICF